MARKIATAASNPIFVSLLIFIGNVSYCYFGIEITPEYLQGKKFGCKHKTSITKTKKANFKKSKHTNYFLIADFRA